MRIIALVSKIYIQNSTGLRVVLFWWQSEIRLQYGCTLFWGFRFNREFFWRIIFDRQGGAGTSFINLNT